MQVQDKAQLLGYLFNHCLISDENQEQALQPESVTLTCVS